jgi:hypothetical protein
MSVLKVLTMWLCAASAIGGVAQDIPQPTPVKLCTISFERDKKRPTRVDNEAKACLDDVSLNLQRNGDVRLVITGFFGTNERGILADQRAVNTKDYLVKEKGIDRSRIEVRAGNTAHVKTAEMSLIPRGTEAVKDSDSHAVNEKTVKASVVHRTDY